MAAAAVAVAWPRRACGRAAAAAVSLTPLAASTSQVRASACSAAIAAASDASTAPPQPQPAREGRLDLRFPHKDTFEFANGAHVLSAAEVLRHLKPVIQTQRQQRLDYVASTKTYSITPVIEGLVNLGNVSAVCRTAEALGYQSLHILRTHQERYKASHNVSKGSEKWLDVVRWDSTRAGLEALRDRGYRIVTTHMHGTALPIGQLDWTVPTAVVLGNEQNGVTDEAVAMADACCIIPMTGFTESFNISVAAAIIMYHAMEDRVRRQGFHADLTPKQQEILQAVWYLKENSMNPHIVERLLDRHLPGASAA